MALNLVKYNDEVKPPRMIFYSFHGQGKSTLAASAPKPLFIPFEDGLDELRPASYPLCKSYSSLISYLKEIYSEKHDYQTLVLDTLDALEPIVDQQVKDEFHIKSLSDLNFGEGWNQVVKKFVIIANSLDKIRIEKRMNIIILSHAVIEHVKNPLGIDYDRFKLRVRDKNANVFADWAEMVGFLHSPVETNIEVGAFGRETVKGIGGMQRVLSTYESACFNCKNRFGITEDIPIPMVNGYDNIAKAIEKGREFLKSLNKPKENS